MKIVNYIVLFILICFSSQLLGQQNDTIVSSNAEIDSLELGRDSISIPLELDSLGIQTDSIPDSVSVKPSSVQFSDQGLDNVIDYGAKDSSFIDLKTNQIHLFGNAYVKYQDYDLKAGYIIFDFDKSEASAFYLESPSGRKDQKPEFTNGENNFTSNGLRFNFKTNKGIIYDALTTEGEYTIHGSRTKFISKDADSTLLNDNIYNKDAIITTCTADHPHFGIKAKKLKVVPDKVAIIGLSQLEIMGIPMPLILPFGFFPLVKGRSSGLIFPSNYEYDDELGLGFREIGYYFPINEYMDMRITGDIYTRGTHRLNIKTNYKKRYKHFGDVIFRYGNNIEESSKDGSRLSNKSFKLEVNHTQDPKSHPYRTIGGKIKLSTNRYDQTNSIEFEDVVNNKISSNFYYKHSMPGTPFSFSSAFTHQQDNKTRKVDITLPDTKLRMNTLYPFKSKTGGEEAWYEKINVGYNANFKNYVTTTDTTLFSDETINNLQTGIQHKATTGANFNVLKYLNVNTSADFEQFVYTRTTRRLLDPELILDTVNIAFDQDSMEIYTIDTTYGQINEDFVNGITSLEKFGMRVYLETQLFATRRFSKGWLRGLRHTMKPSIGFSFRPDTQKKYEEEVQISSNPNEIDEVQIYNPYRGGIFSPSLNTKQMALTYGIRNLFEGKHYSKKDSTEKKFKILQALDINGTYNFAEDSIKFTPLMIRGNTSIFNGISKINFSARYNFYRTDENGVIRKETIWSQKKRPFEFDNFMITISTGFTIGKLIDMFSKKDKSTGNSGSNSASSRSSGSRKKKDVSTQSLGDFVQNFNLSHTFRYEINRENTGRDTAYVRTHNVKLNGNLQLTNSWSLSVNNIQYDIVKKRFIYPDFSLNRDLHCWTMKFSWRPSQEVYSFFIGVKSSSLSFLKYDYGQRNPSQLFGR